MITITTLRSPLDGQRDPIRTESEWIGLTVAEIVQINRRDDWAEGVTVVAALNGRVLEPEEWGLVVAEDAHLVVAGVPGAVFYLTAYEIALQLILAVAVSYVASLLLPKPDVPGLPVLQDDTASPANRWDRITSTYRSGYPIPLVYGERDVPGTVLEATSQSDLGLGIEGIFVVLGLCAGRIEAIGGVTGGTFGEVDRLVTTEFPANLKIDGNLIESSQTASAPSVFSAGAWLRMGTDEQRPIPFVGTFTSLAAVGDLNEKGQQVTTQVLASVTVRSIRWSLEVPGGAYRVNQTTGRYENNGFTLRFYWRPAGTPTWFLQTERRMFYGVGEIKRSYYQFSVYYSFAVPPTGPIDLKVERTTEPIDGADGVNQCRTLTLEYDNSTIDGLAYPGVAHLGLFLAHADKRTGFRPNFSVRVKGMRVRVWDDTINGGGPSGTGYSWDRAPASSTAQGWYWELPPAGDDYAGIWTYPPGKNPAWICADLLTNRDALGAQALGDDQIDWQKFRDWADWCDSSVPAAAGSEARFQCDIVFDSPEEAMRAVIHIMAAGQAKPVRRGRLMSVDYAWNAAHGRGTNSVPEKTRAFLMLSSNITDFGIDYVNTHKRPAWIHVQFQDGEKGFVWDAEPVEDATGGQNDPTFFEPLGVTKVAQQLRGVTRRSQALREGETMHALNRLVTSRVSFTAGPDALACSIGDVVGIEHVAIKPYDSESFGYRLIAAETASTDVHLDHAVTLAPATTYQVIYRDTAGDVQTRTVTATAGTYAAGAAISVSGGTVTAYRSAPIAVGVESAVVVDYVVTRISLGRDMLRKVEAVLWTPNAYDMATESGELDGEQGPDWYPTPASVFLLNPPTPEKVPELKCTPTPDGKRLEVSWGLPGKHRNAPARVYMRAPDAPVDPESTPSESSAARWTAVGETSGTVLESDELPRVGPYTLAVAIRDDDGVWQTPDEAYSASVSPQEFPPVSVVGVRGLTATVLGKSISLAWRPIDSDLLAYYEIRAGREWIAGHRIGRTRESSFSVRNPMPGIAYMVRARFASGLYSRQIATVTPAEWAPDTMSELTDTTLSTFAGTLTDLTYDAGSGELSISDGAFSGTWVTNTFSMGLIPTQEGLSILRIDPRYDHPVTIAELVAAGDDFGIATGEAHWRTMAGRESSPLRPGLNFSESVADVDGLISGMPGRGGHGYLGEVGSEVSVSIEVNYDSGGYEAWVPESRVHDSAVFRVTLARRDLDRNVYLNSARVWQWA